jgi:hypothetical protein
MAELPGGALPVEVPAHESQSNGAVENAVKLLKGMVRVHLLALERKAQLHLPSHHPLMAWLVEHVADVITKYLQGKDGHTAYRRLFGKPVREEGLEFGERVLWRKPKRAETGVVLDPRWSEGVWLGRKWGTTIHRIGVGDVVREVRATQRRPLVERWCRDALSSIRATPWLNPAPADGGGAELPVLAPRVPTEEPAPPPPTPAYQPRRLYIRKEDLDQFGYTANCRRCILMRNGEAGRGVAHHEECRRRVEEAMRAAGHTRLQEAEERQDKEIARRLEERDQVAAPAADAEEERMEDAGEAEVEAEEEMAPELPEHVARLPPSEPHQPMEYNVQRQVAEMEFRWLPPAMAQEAANLYALLVTKGAGAEAARHKVTELYSVPRVTAQLERLPQFPALAPGSTFDLRGDASGRRWDFAKLADRREVRRRVQEEEPYIVIGSPPCTSFCSFTAINHKKCDPERVKREVAEGLLHLGLARGAPAPRFGHRDLQHAAACRAPLPPRAPGRCY